MTNKDNLSRNGSVINRGSIERRMKQKWPELESMAMLNVSDLKRLIHDLKTHQIELQLQNEELRAIQADLDREGQNRRELFDQMPLAAALVDYRGLVQDVNQRLLIILGCERSDLINERFEKIACKDDRDKLYLYQKEIMNNDHAAGIRFNTLKHDGSSSPALLQGGRLSGSQGEDAAIMMTLLDIGQIQFSERTDHRFDPQTLIREMNHRIKNNIAMIDGIVGLGAKDTKDPKAAEIFDAIRQRIRSLAQAHSILTMAGQSNRIKTTDFYNNLIDQHAASMATIGSTLNINKDIYETELSSSTAIYTGLILSELLCNCFKHAYSDKTEGTINIMLRPLGGQMYELVVSDDGDGFPKDFRSRRGALGLELMESLAQSLNGGVDFENNMGAVVTLKYQDIKNLTFTGPDA